MFKSYVKYIAALLLFGSNGLVSSFISLDSSEIVFLRSSIGAVLLLALFFISGRRITAFHYKKDLLFIILSGIAMGGEWLFLFEAYARIGVSLGILINYTGPAIVIALSPFLFKEHISAAKLTALFAALAGVILISGQGLTSGINAIGLMCAGISAVGYSVMVLSIKMVKNVDSTESAVLQLAAGAVFVLLVRLFSGNIMINITVSDWLPVLWLGLINTGLGCFLYFSSMKGLPAQSIAVCGYIEPLSGVLMSVIFLNEQMTLLQAAGAVLIIGGAVFGELAGRKRIAV